jgi:hypothetical protein
MIQLFPDPSNNFVCPRCSNKQVKIEKILFQGIHLVADLQCIHCGFSYYQDFPVGHGILYPAIIDKQRLTLISSVEEDWFSEPLITSLRNPSNKTISVEKIINASIASGDNIIFFNCLDAWFGHVLLKLFNIRFYHEKYPDFKKIVLLPKGFNWMVPDYADEIWCADLKLADTKNYYLQLENFIREELKQYHHVYYSSGYSHPQLQKIEVKDFFKTQPFNIENFDSSPVRITLIYREDRLWIHPFLNRIFNYLQYKKIKFAKKIFLFLQLIRINNLALQLRKSLPDVELYVCGPGNTFSFNKAIVDKRSGSISNTTELEWCKIYSQSHIVIGIHGSSMLIPSSLAAGWIEILPDDRLGNITQDLFCKYNNNKMMFFGRFVSEYDPLKRVVKTVNSMLSDYQGFAEHQIQSYEITK